MSRIKDDKAIFRWAAHVSEYNGHDGNRIWKSVTNKDHILEFAYNEEKQILFGRARDGIVAISPQNGDLIGSYDGYIGDAVFINGADKIITYQ